jgi:enterochelin esterase-like enzyme
MKRRREPTASPLRPAGSVIGPPSEPASRIARPGEDPRSGSRIKALAAGPHTREAVDAFIAGNSFPIVEGSSITFVYRGDAEQVHLKHWVFGLPSSQHLKRIPDTDLWHLTLELPAGSRVEYKLEVVRGGRGEWIQDPLNPNRARDPFGANSVAHGTGYTVPEWISPDPEAAPGTIDEIRFDSQVFGRRGVALYLPARYRRTRRYPLLVVHDGHDYLHYASLGTILDNLIHRREIPDLIVALTSSPNRLGEYAGDERHARFISDELVPNLERTLPLDARPQSRCLMGASFGAVAALTTALARPGFYGRLLLQSGSFAFTDIGDRNARGPLFDPIVALMNHYRANPMAMAERVFVSCGMYESLIYENRSLVPLLTATGMEVRYVEARDGHNWENWRDRLREGLSWLFPGPLLLVYE